MSGAVLALEAELGRLDGVRSASIRTDAEGQPTEVHVVAVGRKAPKQVARDIQSLAAASFGLELDHRIISVVVVEPASEDAPATRPPRMALDMVGYSTEGGTSSAQVRLRIDGHARTRVQSGPSNSHAPAVLPARATVEAAQEFLMPARISLEGVQTLALLGRSVVAVSILCTTRSGEERLLGSAEVKVEVQEASARAVLDALNRRYARLQMGDSA